MKLPPLCEPCETRYHFTRGRPVDLARPSVWVYSIIREPKQLHYQIGLTTKLSVNTNVEELTRSRRVDLASPSVREFDDARLWTTTIYKARYRIGDAPGAFGLSFRHSSSYFEGF